MQDFRDYYQSLGVTQTATADELKTAYRKAARRYHPDLNPGDETAEEKFKEIGEAYEILSDSDRRSEYDQFTQFLENRKNPSKGLFSRGKKGTKDYSQFKDFSMFVDYLLNRRGEANTPASSPSPSAPSSSNPAPTSSAKSRDSTHSSTAQSSASPAASRPKTTADRTSSADQAASNRPSPTPKRSPSPSPAKSPSPFRTRQNSQKSGSTAQRNNPRQTAKIQNPKSKIQNSITEAQLTLPLNKAHKGGKERIRLADGRSLTVTLPPGMTSGQTIQVTAHEPSGDPLSLLIQVAPHDFFTLEMPDVHCTIPITPSEAILGGPISIPTLDGSVKMVVPAGARSGQKLRLPEKGYAFNGQRGDQIVELEIQMPTTVTPRERELYEKIRLTESFRPRKNLYF